MKNIILYVYYKGDYYSELSLEFFLKYGVKDDPVYDYYFINNGELTTQTLPSYFKVIQRPNIGYDFGGWSDVIFSIDINKYDYFIFLNNSTIGPCIPRYLKHIFWPELYYKHINDKIKIVGSTTNFDIEEHIQSYVFCVDKIGLKILIDNNIFIKNLNKPKDNIIFEHEIKMLKSIKNAGYDGYSFETIRNYDSRFKFKNGNLTDQRYYNEVCNHDISPFEVIFVKHRLNTKNNGLIFYLKSFGIELIKSKINNRNYKQEIIPENNSTEVPIANINIIKSGSIISIKNVIDDNKRKKYLMR